MPHIGVPLCYLTKRSFSGSHREREVSRFEQIRLAATPNMSVNMQKAFRGDKAV
jgi:hypothetical protein